MRKKMFSVIGSLIVLAFAAALTVPAASASLLDDIIKSGKVRVAVPIDVPPFGSIGKNKEVEGFDIDLANLLAKDLGVQVELVPTTGVNRVPYLLTGKVDVVISTFGATPDRAKSVSFTDPYAPYFIGIFGGGNLPVKSAADTKGYRVGVPRGTTQDISFSEIAPKECTIIRYEDDATTFQALLSGQVDMIGTGNLIAATLAAKNPGKLNLKFVLRVSPMHIGCRRNEADFLQWLNTFVFHHRLNGDLNKLYKKWLGEEMPELP
jgi:polar amino acid transport system substrate-binding protein